MNDSGILIKKLESVERFSNDCLIGKLVNF